MKLSKEDIRQAVKDHLAWDARIQSTNIEIRVYPNASIVQLDGVVNNLFEKMVARDDALSIPGVSSVVNNLKVQNDGTMHTITDEELQRSIHYILTWDNRIDASRIEIKSASGIVTVKGSVDAYSKKQIVVDQIYHLSNVVEVMDDLNVVPTKDVIDEEIAAEIKSAFKRSNIINAGNIILTVENGFVTLDGFVSSLEEKRIVEEKVFYTTGITGLKNQLSLKDQKLKTMENMTDINLKVSSPSFGEGQEIPAKYTCDGENINPPLNIENLPENTISLALVIEDPDAPDGVFDHWIVWNVEPKHNVIEEHSVPGVQGKNSFGKYGYGGPCPPKGATHRYYFNVFALRKNLQISGADTYKNDLLKAMEGHVLAHGQLMGKYTKRI